MSSSTAATKKRARDDDDDDKSTRVQKKSTNLSDAQKRAQVFDAIVGEMRYQADRATNDEWDHENVPPVAAEILLIEEYVAKARTQYTVNPGDEQALHELRKVAAMCVRAMVNHGVHTRKGYA